jgi:hypothetical protein
MSRSLIKSAADVAERADVEEALDSEQTVEFVRGFLKLRDTKIEDEEQLKEVLAALRRSPVAADVKLCGLAPLYREGHDDEYEAMVQVGNLKHRKWCARPTAEALPDVLRFSRGLPAPPGLLLRVSGGTICCDLDALREDVRAELRAGLVEGPSKDSCSDFSSESTCCAARTTMTRGVSLTANRTVLSAVTRLCCSGYSARVAAGRRSRGSSLILRRRNRLGLRR